jgi:hypothetical protein
VEAIREDLGKVGPVIAAQVEEAMLGRRRELDTSRAERESEPVRKLLKFERKLRDQLEKLVGQLHETQRVLRLSPGNIQNVVEIGLALAGQPSLRQVEVPGLTGPAFQVPPLTGSWSRCADGLAHPHTKEIRPVVFDHALATGRDDVVLCHLNHRLVQMCLGLLRAEVWSRGLARKLNRFTTRMVADNVLQTPAVIMHGRLLVLGGDNLRIHEEIILAGGAIKEGRFSRMNLGETQTAYAAASDQNAPRFVEDRLKQIWPRIEAPLLQALEARMGDRTKNLQGFLDQRADTEAKQITAIMNELQRSIRATLDDKDDLQMQFDWSETEKQQRERDIQSLSQRLQQIPDELTREIEHLRSRYSDPKPRLFPVAVTFLVPHRAVAQLRQGGAQ